MLESTARQQLGRLLANTQEPILAADVVNDLLLQCRVQDRYGNPPDPYHSWQPDTDYALGARVVRQKRGEFELTLGGNYYQIFEAQHAGTSGANEPVWPTIAGNTVDDGTATVWVVTELATYWVGAFNLNYAAAKGWLQKAGLLSGNYGLTIAGNQLQRDQAYKHAVEMYQRFLRKASLSSVRMRRTQPVPGQPSADPFGPLPVDSKFINTHRYLEITDRDRW